MGSKWDLNETSDHRPNTVEKYSSGMKSTTNHPFKISYLPS